MIHTTGATLTNVTPCELAERADARVGQFIQHNKPRASSREASKKQLESDHGLELEVVFVNLLAHFRI